MEKERKEKRVRDEGLLFVLCTLLRVHDAWAPALETE